MLCQVSIQMRRYQTHRPYAMEWIGTLESSWQYNEVQLRFTEYLRSRRNGLLTGESFMTVA